MRITRPTTVGGFNIYIAHLILFVASPLFKDSIWDEGCLFLMPLPIPWGIFSVADEYPNTLQQCLRVKTDGGTTATPLLSIKCSAITM